MERLKRIVFYLAGFIIIINIYAIMFHNKWLITEVKPNVFLVIMGLFILSTQVTEGIVYLVYTVVNLKPWMRIVVTTLCSLVVYSIVIAYLLPRLITVILVRPEVVLLVILPIALVGSIVFDLNFMRKKQSLNEKLKIYQKKS